MTALQKRDLVFKCLFRGMSIDDAISWQPETFKPTRNEVLSFFDSVINNRLLRLNYFSRKDYDKDQHHYPKWHYKTQWDVPVTKSSYLIGDYASPEFDDVKNELTKPSVEQTERRSFTERLRDRLSNKKNYKQ